MYSMTNITTLKISNFKAYKKKVFITDLEHGDTITKAGLILTDDNMTNRGIRPRWGKVWAIGAEVEDIEVGQWVLIEHGRWTQKISLDYNGEIINIWSVEYPESGLMVSDEDPRGRFATIADQGKTFAVGKR